MILFRKGNLTKEDAAKGISGKFILALVLIFSAIPFIGACDALSNVEPLTQPSIPDTSDITFVVVSDPQITDKDETGEKRRANRRIVEEINRLALGDHTVTWPQGSNSAGLAVDEPVAVLMNGDLTNWAHDWQREVCLQLYDNDYPDSDEGEKLILPAYPGLGNHDVCQTRGNYAGAMRDYIEARVKDSDAVTNYHDYTRNYSWDWGNTHFIQLNLWAGDIDWSQFGYENLTDSGSCLGHDDVRSSNRNQGLAWLQQDLAANVGSSGKKVVVLQHVPFNYRDVWETADYNDTVSALKPYNVAGIFCGHSHNYYTRSVFTSTSPGWGTVYNYVGGHGGWVYGFSENADDLGFVVVRITDSFIDVAFYHVEETLSPAQLIHMHSRSY
ncbi:MAG: hypothetical protein GY754_43135 [bacterium]|nr:hypothetical protein [bacterium]